jgi:hypothetical protein
MRFISSVNRRSKGSFMRRAQTAPQGTVHRLTIESQVLKSNMLGDPATRLVDVYVPAGSDGRGLPLLVDLVGFTAGGPAHTNWSAGKRGVFGKSSGGYGAIAHALLHPEFWSAAACHSGDMGFEHCYLRDMPKVLRAIAKTNGSIKEWLEAFFAKKKTKDDEVHILMALAMCATYDPDPSAYMGVRLPVDLETCELIPERWANFQKWDPVRMAETRGAGLKKMKALYIDCGEIDQYDLVYGARMLTRLLKKHDVPHTYEEFADDHSSVDYRMDVSLPMLAKALS